MTGNPQVEDGYTRIANEIMEALAKYRIPGNQMQCLLVIFRQTYGWQKKTADISLNEFAKSTGLHRANVHRSLKILESHNMIGVVKGDNTSSATYSFNKKYKTWGGVVKLTPVVREDYKGVVTTDNPTIKERKETSTADAALKLKIDQKAEELYKSGRFIKVHAFINKTLKDQRHAGALYRALSQFQKSGKPDAVAWPYCAKVVGVESGNFAEQDFQKNIKKQQEELRKWESKQ